MNRNLEMILQKLKFLEVRKKDKSLEVTGESEQNAVEAEPSKTIATRFERKLSNGNKRGAKF